MHNSQIKLISTISSLRNLTLKTLLILICLIFIINKSCPKNFDLLAFKLQSSANHQEGKKDLSFPSSAPKLRPSSSLRNPACTLNSKQIIFFILMLAGDIQSNPGPPTHIYPCGLCELPVTWSTAGICCDQCDAWHHMSCIDLKSQDYTDLGNSSKEWKCFKCDTVNLESFTYHSFCLDSSSSVSFAHSSASSIPSPTQSSFPHPPILKCSTPIDPSKFKPSNSPCANVSSISNSSSECSSNPLTRPKETFGNLRILNINCQGIRSKTA